jgi:hypothetical protein
LNSTSKDVFKIGVKVIVSLTHFYRFDKGIDSSLFLAN